MLGDLWASRPYASSRAEGHPVARRLYRLISGVLSLECYAPSIYSRRRGRSFINPSRTLSVRLRSLVHNCFERLANLW